MSNPLPPAAVFPLLLPSSFLEQLHKHQGAVLHPDYKTSFRSFDDALQRLLPYHVYQGVLPSTQDYRKGKSSQGMAQRSPGLLKHEDSGSSFKKKWGYLVLQKKKRETTPSLKKNINFQENILEVI